jgi:hypothetical protein
MITNGTDKNVIKESLTWLINNQHVIKEMTIDQQENTVVKITYKD